MGEGCLHCFDHICTDCQEEWNRTVGEIKRLREALLDIIQKADFHGNYTFSDIARRALREVE